MSQILMMKTSTCVIVGGVLFFLGCLGYDAISTRIGKVEKKIAVQQISIDRLQGQPTMAAKLTNTMWWYIVNPTKVSSAPDGKGDIVELDVPLKTQMGPAVQRHPDYNRLVRFTINNTDLDLELYTVAGGAISYIIMDN